MNKELLYKCSKETQLLIKQEGEKNLEDIHKSESLITNKINNLLSFSITFLIAVIGFLVKCISENVFNLLFILSIFSFFVFLLTIITLFKSILPIENRLLGSEPNKLLQNDLIKGDEYDEIRIISNKILNIQRSIEKSISSYNIRLTSYKDAINILFFGIIVSLIITVIIFLLCQF